MAEEPAPLLAGLSAAGVSSFQALAISLSGRVGVGNIAGVATAINFGGVRRIANFAELVVPFMALGYIIVAVVIKVVTAFVILTTGM